MYSVANFALNILLARWLIESQYGAFGTTYALFLLGTLAHSALLSEPMLVFGSQRYRAGIFAYYRVLVRFHWVLSLCLSGLAVAAFLILTGLGERPLARGALGIAVSSWSILLFYLYRRVCYVIDRVGSAALAGAVYLTGLLVGTYALFRTDSLGVFGAYCAMGLAALAATAVLHVLIWRPAEGTNVATPSSVVLREHYDYGKWALGSGLLIWLPANIYYLVLPYSGGLPANAAFKALMNFAMPMIQTNLALANVLLPGLARLTDRTLLLGHLRRFVLLVSIGCVLYWLLIGFFAEGLFRLMYGGRYLEHAGLLWLIGLTPLVSWLALAERSAFKAINRPDTMFRASAVGAGVSVALGVPLTYWYALNGAIMSMIACYASMYLWLRRSPDLRRAT